MSKDQDDGHQHGPPGYDPYGGTRGGQVARRGNSELVLRRALPLKVHATVYATKWIGKDLAIRVTPIFLFLNAIFGMMLAFWGDAPFTLAFWSGLLIVTYAVNRHVSPDQSIARQWAFRMVVLVASGLAWVLLWHIMHALGASVINEWMLLAYWLYGCAAWAWLYTAKRIGTKKAWAHAQRDFAPVAARIGLAGASIVKRVKTPLGEKILVDVRGTGQTASQVIRGGTLADSMAAHADLAPGMASAAPSAAHAGYVEVSTWTRNPWAKPIPHPMAPAFGRGRRNFMGGIPVGVEPETGKQLTITLVNEDGGLHWIFIAGTRGGKLLPLTTVVPSPSGWTTMGDIKDGDLIFDETGAVTTVVCAHPVTHDRLTYDVVFDDGSVVTACGDHLWATSTRAQRRAGDGDSSVVSTDQIKASLRAADGDFNHAIVVTAPLQYAGEDIPEPAFMTGFEIGQSRCAIPAPFLRAPIEQREALLMGLVGATGYWGDRGPSWFISSERAISCQVLELAIGLGYVATMSASSYRGKPGIVYIVNFDSDRAGNSLRYIVDVRPVPSVPMRCLTVDSPSRLYLVGQSCIPTHNTNLINNVVEHLTDCVDQQGRPLVQLTLIDTLKGQKDAANWGPAVHRVFGGPKAIHGALAALQRSAALIAERAEKNGARGRSKHVPTFEEPADITIIDEASFLMTKRTPEGRRAIELVQTILKAGASELVLLIIASQRAVLDHLGTSDVKANAFGVAVLPVRKPIEQTNIISDWRDRGMPDMSTFGDGAKGCVLIMLNNEWSAGRTYELWDMMVIRKIAMGRVLPEHAAQVAEQLAAQGAITGAVDPLLSEPPADGFDDADTEPDPMFDAEPATPPMVVPESAPVQARAAGPVPRLAARAEETLATGQHISGDDAEEDEAADEAASSSNANVIQMHWERPARERAQAQAAEAAMIQSAIAAGEIDGEEPDGRPGAPRTEGMDDMSKLAVAVDRAIDVAQWAADKEAARSPQERAIRAEYHSRVGANRDLVEEIPSAISAVLSALAFSHEEGFGLRDARASLKAAELTGRPYRAASHYLRMFVARGYLEVISGHPGHGDAVWCATYAQPSQDAAQG